MSDVWGNAVKLSIFGESHGPAIGVVLDGIEPGVRLDMEEIRRQMARRAPGQRLSTPSRYTWLQNVPGDIAVPDSPRKHPARPRQ